MAFRSLGDSQITRYNSELSHNFLDLYESALDASILEGETRTPSRTFAPSQIRCKRVSWFRLRGVLPEPETIADRGLDFTAKVGTACHQNIQKILSEKLGKDWIDVEWYLNSAPRLFKYTCTKGDYETKVEIEDPPVKFAPDGIIFYQGKYRLLEIKTSEYNSFDALTAPKPQHIDQIICYGTLLGIPDVIFLYQDRMFGNLKCFEYTISEGEMILMRTMIKDVQHCVERNIAPERPENKRYCTPSYCRYYNKCKEW